MFKTFILPRMSNFYVLCNPSPKSVIYNLWQYLWYFKRSWLFSSNKNYTAANQKCLRLRYFSPLSWKRPHCPFDSGQKLIQTFAWNFDFINRQEKSICFEKQQISFWIDYSRKNLVQQKQILVRCVSFKTIQKEIINFCLKIVQLTAIINCSWESL